MPPAGGRSERASPCCGTFLGMDPTKLPPPEDAPLGPGDLARVRARYAWRDWDRSELAEELVPWPASLPDAKRPPSGTAP